MPEAGPQFKKTLIIDDEEALLRVLSRFLKTSSQAIETLNSAPLAIEAVISAIRERLIPGLLLTLDGQYSDGTALTIIEALQIELSSNKAHVVLITGDENIAQNVRDRFPQVQVVEKPFEASTLHSAISSSVPFTQA